MDIFSLSERLRKAAELLGIRSESRLVDLRAREKDTESTTIRTNREPGCKKEKEGSVDDHAKLLAENLG